ncbi:unnamed protein product [Rhizoctonia solani]|uniref:AIG1-type G domain-containing protein n=1 Tax=Rhizoctonia solani TaxID=456999 RepID=A0A8H3BE01_9AGAM|nr:unnamed protein product [Rhizoctonia solani]
MTETIAPDPSDTQGTGYEPQSTEDQVIIDIPNLLGKRSVFDFPKKKRIVTILLVGETGGGKTAFLSLLLNLLHGNGPFELEQKYFKAAESGLDKTQSQTTKATLYIFTTTEGVQFQIIDTPGLADTRGIGQNNKHREIIYRAVKELVTTIDGIILVANGRNERLAVTTSYTLETLATLLPRSVKDNIGILFTNVHSDERGLNFQMEALPSDLKTATYWCLDNPLSSYKKHWAQLRKATEAERQLSTQANNLKEDYEETVQSLDKWLEWLNERETMPTTTIVELYQKSTEIESRLFETTVSLENLARLRKELKAIIKDLHSVEQERISLSEVLNRAPPKIWESKATLDYNTICLSADCHHNCHLQCSLELNDPHDIGGWCKVFKTFGVPNWLIPFKDNSKVKCSECGHEASEHRNFKVLWEERPSKIYQDALQGIQDTESSKESLEGARDHIKKELDSIAQGIEESKQDITRLVDEMNSLSLSPSYAGYIRSAIQLFELRKKQLEACADSDEELTVIDKGITTFKKHLQLLKHSKVARVISTSYRAVERAFEGEDYSGMPGAMF